MTLGSVTRGGVLLAVVLLALTVLVPSASAATRAVHLTNDGPVPVSLTVKAGDTVVFVNDDTVPHQVRSQGAWQYDSGAIPPGQTSGPTPRLTAPGTYRYSDLRGIVFLPQTFSGALRVAAPAPSPSPTRPPSSSPSPRPTHSATPSPAASHSRSATPSPTPSATSTPTHPPRPTQSAVVPPPVAAPTPTPLYGDPQALVQGSPHRYGLPALLAGVALGGVLSLMVRFLLALPEGRRPGNG